MSYYDNKKEKHTIKLTKNKTKNKNGTTYTKYVITIPKELIHDCELEDEEFVIVEKINYIPGFLCRKKIPELDNFWSSAMAAQRRDLNESSDKVCTRCGSTK